MHARNKLQLEKTAFALFGTVLFCCTVPLQMDGEIKDGLKGMEDQPCRSRCASAEDKNKLAYCVTDVPPWYLCIALSIQVCALCGCRGTFLLVVSESSESVHYCLKVEDVYRNCCSFPV